MHWAESYHNTQFDKDSAKMHHKQFPYIHLHQHQSQEQLHGAPQPSCGSTPEPTSAAQKWSLILGPWVLPFQSGYKTILKLLLISSPSETSLPCKESVLSLPFLFPDCLTSSCSWVFFPSTPDYSLVTNYHRWAVITRFFTSNFLEGAVLQSG